MVEDKKQETEKKEERKKPVASKESREKSVASQESREKESSSSSEKPIKDIKEKQEDTEKKQEEKKETKEDKKPKKAQAVVSGKNLSISTKHAVAICNYIRGKNIDNAISILEQVEKFKKAVPIRGEIPHRKGKIMSGKYPIKAVKEFIKLLKSLRANAIVNELELEKYVLFCMSNVAARPYRRFGKGRFKRTHVILKLIQPVKKIKNQK